MRLRLALMVAALAIAAAGAFAQSQWKDAGGIGMRHFVVVNADAAVDTEVLKRAAAVTCEPTQACIVAFLSNAAAVPTSMPMTKVQQQAVVAQYIRNPVSGTEELLLRCPTDKPADLKCLR